MGPRVRNRRETLGSWGGAFFFVISGDVAARPVETIGASSEGLPFVDGCK